MIKTKAELLNCLNEDKKMLPRVPSIADYFYNRPLWDLWKLHKLLRHIEYLRNNATIFNKAKLIIASFRLKKLNNKYRTWFFPGVFDSGLRIHHLEVGGITIAPTAKIGKNFSVRQFCTIGYNGKDYSRAAVIDDNVDMSVGACIYGHVKIGRGAQIGAYSIVTQNIPPYAIVAGNPAKIVGYRMTPEEIVQYEIEHYSEEERLPISKIERNYNKYFENRLKVAEYLSLY